MEKIFSYLQIASASYVAFAHGSNDVANAVGPVSAALGLFGAEIPRWLLAIGGLGIVIGLSTWGYRVIETVGERITALTNKGLQCRVRDGFNSSDLLLSRSPNLNNPHSRWSCHRSWTGQRYRGSRFKCCAQNNILLGGDCSGYGFRNAPPLHNP